MRLYKKIFLLLILTVPKLIFSGTVPAYGNCKQNSDCQSNSCVPRPNPNAVSMPPEELNMCAPNPGSVSNEGYCLQKGDCKSNKCVSNRCAEASSHSLPSNTKNRGKQVAKKPLAQPVIGKGLVDIKR